MWGFLERVAWVLLGACLATRFAPPCPEPPEGSRYTVEEIDAIAASAYNWGRAEGRKERCR